MYECTNEVFGPIGVCFLRHWSLYLWVNKYKKMHCISKRSTHTWCFYSYMSWNNIFWRKIRVRSWMIFNYLFYGTGIWIKYWIQSWNNLFLKVTGKYCTVYTNVLKSVLLLRCWDECGDSKMMFLWPCDYHVSLCKGCQGCTVIDFLLKQSVIFVLCGTRNVVYFSFVLYLVPCKPRLCFCKHAKGWSALNLIPNRWLYSKICVWKAQMCLFKCPRRWTDCKFSETLICPYASLLCCTTDCCFLC